MTDGARDATGGVDPDADVATDDAPTDEADGTLVDLLAGNRRHVDSRPDDAGEGGERGDDRPPIVAACCPDARVEQAATWGLEDPGRLVVSATIGAQVWDEVDGERVVDGDLLFPLVETGGGTVIVVGHTGCHAVTTAYRVATGTADGESVESSPPGVRTRLGSLVPVVEAALDAGVARTGRERGGAGERVDVVVETPDDADADEPDVIEDATDADAGPVTIEIGDDGTGDDGTGTERLRRRARLRRRPGPGVPRQLRRGDRRRHRRRPRPVAVPGGSASGAGLIGSVVTVSR
jgi:hypothetical protein